MVAEYELVSGAKEATISASHHEHSLHTQKVFLEKVFLEKVGRLTNILHDMGHVVQEESSDVLPLATKDMLRVSKIVSLGPSLCIKNVTIKSHLGFFSWLTYLSSYLQLLLGLSLLYLHLHNLSEVVFVDIMHVSGLVMPLFMK